METISPLRVQSNECSAMQLLALICQTCPELRAKIISHQMKTILYLITVQSAGRAKFYVAMLERGKTSVIWKMAFKKKETLEGENYAR